MRLIDAEKIKYREHRSGGGRDYPENIAYEYEIEKMPTVNAVPIPCKIGDQVWAIRTFHATKHPQAGIVSGMYFLPDMRLQIVVKYVARGKWGKTVFATYEEAQAAIEERKNNEQAYF